MNPMLEILGIAILIGFITSYLRRRILTPEDMARMMESQKYKKMLLEAKRKDDKKALQKLMRKQDYYRKIDAEIGKKNMIIMFTSIGIFWAAWAILTPIYGHLDTVALLPGDLMIPLISHGNKLSFFGWFILSLLASNIPLGKVFEVKPMEVEKHAEKGAKD